MDELRKSAITGSALEIEINTTPPERKSLVEGFLHEYSVLMISADSGTGKSVIMATALAQMTCGSPVFGALQVPRPLRCYYIPFERGRREIEERLLHISSTVKPNYDNLWINDNFMGMNVIERSDADAIVNTIRKDCPNPDVIFIDPIYQSVAGGLSNDEKASMFTRFSTRLQVEFNCTNWLSHHTVKDTFSQQTGKKIEKDDPFYGSTWLKAHCTAAYFMKRDPSNGGVILTCKKDSHSNMIKSFTLGYDPENYISFCDDVDLQIPHFERFKSFINNCFNCKKMFIFSDLERCLKGVSHATLRRYLIHPVIKDFIKKHKNNGKNTLYEVLALV